MARDGSDQRLIWLEVKFICFQQVNLQQDQFSESLNDFTEADVFTRRARINSKTWQQSSFVPE